MSGLNNNLYYNIVFEVLADVKQLENITFEGGNLTTADVLIKVRTGEGQEKGSISLRYDYLLNLKDVHLSANNVRQTYMHKTLDITSKIREAVAKVKALYEENC